VLNRIERLLNAGCITANGKTLGENVKTARPFGDDVIRPLEQPLYSEGGIAVLYGNLAPDGAVIKTSAASPELLRHRGRAFVFETHDEMLEQIDRDDLPVDATTV